VIVDEDVLPTGALESLTWRQGAIAAGALLGFVLVAKLGGHLVRRSLARRGREGGAFALSKLLTYLLVFIGVVTALGLLGIPLGSLLLTSSALLIGLGFSLQHVAQDFISGIVILVEQAIRKDDVVTFEETVGTVIEIGLRSTRLLTPDGTTLIVPNHTLTSNEVSNLTSPRERSRVHVEVPVGTREDVDLVERTLHQIAAQHVEVMPDPDPIVRLEAIHESHLEFSLIVWVTEPIAMMRVASELRMSIVREFARQDIEFPVPELELHQPVKLFDEARKR
jgi:small-conductance mechanosensitive channel